MTPVLQTQFGDAKGEAAGNCLQAAVASLFDLPLADVPHFVASDRWWQDMQAWLLRERNCFAVYVEKKCLRGTDMHDSYNLQIGRSPRGDFHHVVVSRNGEMVHDPHPDATGLTEITGEYLFVKVIK